MRSHFENLKVNIPNLEGMEILDLGAGKGKFLIELASIKMKAKGVELFLEYIEEAKNSASIHGVSIDIQKGVGEKLPFEDKSFDFVNMSEVIEHVDNPEKVLKETNRVLRNDGKVYISVPSRFSIKDTHFHLYFVNWVPRTWSDTFISIFGRHKNYSKDAGNQKLKDLHYYTKMQFKKLASETGFEVEDIRELKIKKERGYKKLLLPVYILISGFYFNTYHFLLTKKS